MILGFTIAIIVLASVVALVCIALGLVGKVPSDLTVGAVVLLALVMFAQIIVSIVAPLTGNGATGSLLEFWTYLISAALIPVAVIVWAFVDRTRWATVIMGVGAIAVAIMVWRMQVIWTLPVG